MAQLIQIGARNATFQQIETLKRNREKRHKQGLFFVESVHAIEQAVYHRWQFEAICYARGVRLSGWARDMLSKAGAAHHYEMSQELMAELSDRDEPCELIALIRMRSNEEALEAMRNAPADRPRLFIAFDRPQNPGNLGSIIRSADAMGASGVIITGHGADLHDPLCVRSSIGAFFALPTAALGGPEDVVKWMDGFDKRPVLIGTSAHATMPVHKVDFQRDVVLAVGNETFGLSKAWKAACDEMALIPIHGAASSLNVACATSIFIYEALRQRLICAEQE